MKKALPIILALLLMLLPAAVFAAEPVNPFDGTGAAQHIYVIDDLGSYSGPFESQENINYLYDGSNPVDKLAHDVVFKDGVLEITGAGTSQFSFTPAAFTGTGTDVFADAVGIGFYIKNTGDNDIILGWQNINSGNKPTYYGGFVQYYDIAMKECGELDFDPSWTPHRMPVIPSDFEGYVLFDFGKNGLRYRTETDWVPGRDRLDGFGFVLRGDLEGGALTIDNFFLYGDGLEDNDPIGILPSFEPTEAPTDEPTDAPTDEPTQPAGEATDAPVDDDPAQTAANTTDAPAAPGNPLVPVIIGIMGVVIVAAVVIIILLARKSKKN